MDQKQELKYLPVRLPEERYELLRIASFETKRSMSAIINEALQQWLEHWEDQRK